MTPSLARALGYKVDHGALIVDVKRRQSRGRRPVSAGAPGKSTSSAAR